ncbi:hypothetical protein EJB05_55273, partial [Eragrostis curvula]
MKCSQSLERESKSTRALPRPTDTPLDSQVPAKQGRRAKNKEPPVSFTEPSQPSRASTASGRQIFLAMACDCKLLSAYLLLLLAHAAAASGAGVKIVVYWGLDRNEGSLAKTCATGHYAIVVMAFLWVFDAGQTPVLNLANHCNPSGNGCTGLASEIASCQSSGIKVILSIGGGTESYGLASTDEAQRVASYIWNNFLGGTSPNRPFGNAVLDGIDLDLVTGFGPHYDDLAKNLTWLYRGDTAGKTYLLTAAPRCPYPDASLGTAFSTVLFDHLWVQFYNNPSCQYASGDASNLTNAWEQWTRAWPSASIFLGLPASSFAAAAGGYIPPHTLELDVLPAVNGSACYGGIALWNRYYDVISGYSAKLLGKANPPIGSPIPGASPPQIDPPIGSPIPLPKKSIRIYIIAGISSLSGVCIILFTFFLWYKKYYGKMAWQRGSRNAPRIESFLQKQGTSHYPKRGNMSDGSEVAVKMLKDTEGDGEEFMNEVASISRTSHINVVTLLGFCLQGSKRALLYEYMPNGSLERYTFGSNSAEGENTSTWEKLFNIVVGIARGLEYLHNGCNTRIVHFDIKPQNILLDQDFCPKISDFGLAKLCRQKESKISIAGARGTIGYIAPEVFSRNYGAVSSKSDVYSYGMVVLDMLGVRKQIEVSTDNISKCFPQCLYDNLDQFRGAACEISSDTTELVRKMTIVGLWCIQFTPADRPSMSKVLEMLESNTVDLQLPPKAF